MSKSDLLTAVSAVILLAGGSALAENPPDGGGMSGGRGGGVGAGRAGGPSHMAMPPRGFRSAPSGFHGSLPKGAPRSAPHFQVGRSGHDLGSFESRRFSQFTPDERSRWAGGGWRHESHNGYLGWWWVVGDAWFFYLAPIYPYPDYVHPRSRGYQRASGRFRLRI